MQMLKVYEPTYFSLISSWITDKDILFQYSGSDFSYPFTEKQIQDYQRKHPDRKFYLGFLDSDSPYAFGEIIPQRNRTVRLARILIGAPRNRGKGLGQVFIRELLAEAERTFKVNSVDLYVIADNRPAVHCYLKVGFQFIANEDAILTHDGKDFRIRKMRIDI